jgi:adenylyl cyclase-associated protein
MASSKPLFELQDKKWVVEFQKDKKDLVIDGEINQTIAVYRCNGSMLKVNGKVKNIFINDCKEFAVVFDSCVSGVDVVNSKKIQMQVTKHLPTVSIDGTTNTKVFLSKDSLDTEIVSSMSNEINLYVPTDDGEDVTEHPVPEQFTTTYDKKEKKFVTEPGTKAVGE